MCTVDLYINASSTSTVRRGDERAFNVDNIIGIPLCTCTVDKHPAAGSRSCVGYYSERQGVELEYTPTSLYLVPQARTTRHRTGYQVVYDEETNLAHPRAIGARVFVHIKRHTKESLKTSRGKENPAGTARMQGVPHVQSRHEKCDREPPCGVHRSLGTGDTAAAARERQQIYAGRPKRHVII